MGVVQRRGAVGWRHFFAGTVLGDRRKGRLSVQPTLIEPPAQPNIPEPSPPPDEGTPPTPPLIPEPAPPPDEGTPPTPEPVPEPSPPDELS